ncbi:hypothetical protein AURDEDRAFT_120732 [Auricularia subglabra TFB-10046 SS5]|nr:hypothetical protein AURDEDRAFT_120732 [Auricularia subglabra TFB-10046 SS5]
MFQSEAMAVMPTPNRYLAMACLTWIVYDFFLTSEGEIELIWNFPPRQRSQKRNGSFAKFIFVLLRCSTFGLSVTEVVFSSLGFRDLGDIDAVDLREIDHAGMYHICMGLSDYQLDRNTPSSVVVDDHRKSATLEDSILTVLARDSVGYFFLMVIVVAVNIALWMEIPVTPGDSSVR